MQKYRFPSRFGHRSRLLVDGDQFFPAMEEQIAAARDYLLLEMYLFESGRLAERIIDGLLAAVARGVRVCLLLDAYGARALCRRDRQRLLAAGVELTFYNPLRLSRWTRNLLRNHRKLLLVDGRVVFTGGAGITDLFDPAIRPHHYWHEAMLELHGPCVRDWQALFAKTWDRWAQQPLTLLPPAPPAAAGEGAGRVAVQDRTVAGSEIMRSYVKRIRRARKRVWFATAYFVPPWKLRRALRRQARRGRDVRLLLPGPCTDHSGVRHMGRRFYLRLLRSGVRIYEFQPRFLHVKLLLCDGWISIGSCNADGWNYRWSLEANQELEDRQLQQQAEELFATDFAASEEIRYQDWLQRSWLRHLREWFWGRIAALLAWFSDRKNGRPDSDDGF